MDRIDKYELIAEIGRGAMGAVYKALHPRFKKYVAIKEIRSDLTGSLSVQQRFQQEAELLARLPAHPNLVTIRDALVWQNRLYLVMDYIEGGTLADIVKKGGADPDYGAMVLGQILAGLQAIHSRGIIHHDLKASNILIDREGRAYISDFGIAEYRGKRLNSPVMASARYVAPEVIDPSLGRGGVEEQIDIYSAGMVAYEMLLGEALFRREFVWVYNAPQESQGGRWLDWHTNLASVARKLNDINQRIPGPLANVVGQMMAKDVRQRYREAEQVRRDLNGLVSGAMDVRGRRVEPPGDDATLPIDRFRGAGGRKTGPDSHEAPVHIYQGPREEKLQAAPKTRESRFPKWPWLVGASAVLLLVMVLAIFLAFMPRPGFTLEIRGAPSGSDVYIDKTRFGLSHADGRITVAGLRAGSRAVRVAHDGYTDFEDVITGMDGDVKSVYTLMKETKQEDPSQIDYHGLMILIPAGEFIMGDNNHDANEKPAHNVTLPDYYIDKFEVSNEQYKRFCDETNRTYPTKLPQYEEYFNKNPSSPVMGISWDDAAAYAEHYSKRLLTEEEWEKAASWDPATRTKRQWPWGNSADPSLANLSGQPLPIGRFPGGASSYGVQDMAGNASEWVSDYYKPYSQNQTPDPDYGTKDKVVKGGSFTFKIEDARTPHREHWPADTKAQMVGAKKNNSTIGFRCAVSANDQKLQEFLRTRGQ
jgi:formylglycine-generating enzyme required for sulfatase activity/serine/threonine protein kinase